MQTTLTNITDKITNRCIYTDINDNIINTGDAILFFELTRNFIFPNRLGNRTKKFAKYNGKTKGVFAFFYRHPTKNECKFIFNGGNKHIFVRTLYDNDYNKHNKKVIKLNCIKGNFDNMDDKFKEDTNYNNAKDAYYRFFNK